MTVSDRLLMSSAYTAGLCGFAVLIVLVSYTSYFRLNYDSAIIESLRFVLPSCLITLIAIPFRLRRDYQVVSKPVSQQLRRGAILRFSLSMKICTVFGAILLIVFYLLWRNQAGNIWIFLVLAMMVLNVIVLLHSVFRKSANDRPESEKLAQVSLSFGKLFVALFPFSLSLLAGSLLLAASFWIGILRKSLVYPVAGIAFAFASFFLARFFLLRFIQMYGLQGDEPK